MFFGKTFRGGIHPAGNKERTAELPIEDFPLPERVSILLSQHIGAACVPTVAKGDEVRTGQAIGEPRGFISSPIHSSITGKVVAIEDRPSPVTGARTPAVIIDRTGEDLWAEGTNIEQDVSTLTPADVRERILAAGIVGMGGATFPTHVKLTPPPDKPIDTAILNGAECEPYLNGDNRLMIEKPADVVAGFLMILRALNCRQGIIGIEANKPRAFESMKNAAAGHSELRVERLHTKYPQGGEHQLIKALLGREVPWHGGLPMAIGALVQNVASAKAVYDAVKFRRPIIDRVLTITGDGIENPGNYRVRIGTPIGLLLDKAIIRPEAKKLILGGPLMGIAQRTNDVPVAKGTNAVLVLTKDVPAKYGPCICCGRCLVCPYGLTPAMFSRAVEANDYERAEEWDVMECKECGCCAYVCPSKRPMVQQAKLAKAEILRRRAQQRPR